MSNVKAEIFFRGGDICVGADYGTLPGGERAVSLRLAPLKRPAKIGESAQGLEIEGSTVDLVFIKPESIDVVIEALNIMKAKLK